MTATTYRVEWRAGDRKVWHTYAEDLDNLHARMCVDRAFLYEPTCQQAVMINERSGRVVGRFEYRYDSRRKCQRLIRVGTR